jgi:hypothetical protein
MTTATVDHTPEPWRLFKGHLSGYGAFPFAVADDDDETSVLQGTVPNLKRAVAAVNACKGIPTSSLEGGVIEVLLQALKTVKEPEFKRPHTNSGYLHCVDCDGNNYHEESCWYYPIDQALAKLEGRA